MRLTRGYTIAKGILGMDGAEVTMNEQANIGAAFHHRVRAYLGRLGCHT
jgi:hypothetical protein